MTSPNRLLVVSTIVVIVLFGIYAYYQWFDRFPPRQDMVIGVSFSAEQARWLGLDPATVFQKLLDEYRFRRLRLSAQWASIEPRRGEYQWTDLDDLMNRAARAGAKVMLAVGQKTPRWPECHLPEWAKDLSHQERIAALYRSVEVIVKRYRNHPALEMWQVENEPFLGFGICPPFLPKDFTGELALVKRLDPAHPILTSDSGELSPWRRTARATDYFGTTLYRVVWNRLIGYWNYDWLPPAFYRAKLRLTGRDRASTFITELQAEPWIPHGVTTATPLTEQARSMNLHRLRQNIVYARRLGVPRAYLWGAEWWEWLAKQGKPAMAEDVKAMPKE
ncbi:MAG: beta-galactosidase [Candidatus Magasanikbacteria bacterium]|nr:beta-galactosidase [Candidatus Magasanikbacteria bacterium]